MICSSLNPVGTACRYLWSHLCSGARWHERCITALILLEHTQLCLFNSLVGDCLGVRTAGPVDLFALQQVHQGAWTRGADEGVQLRLLVESLVGRDSPFDLEAGSSSETPSKDTDFLPRLTIRDPVADLLRTSKQRQIPSAPNSQRAHNFLRVRHVDH